MLLQLLKKLVQKVSCILYQDSFLKSIFDTVSCILYCRYKNSRVSCICIKILFSWGILYLVSNTFLKVSYPSLTLIYKILIFLYRIYSYLYSYILIPLNCWFSRPKRKKQWMATWPKKCPWTFRWPCSRKCLPCPPWLGRLCWSLNPQAWRGVILLPKAVDLPNLWDCDSRLLT